MANSQQTDIPEHSTAYEERYRQLFETAEDGLAILDALTGEIVDANSFLLNLLGYSLAEIQGQRIWEIVPFKDLFETRLPFADLQAMDHVRYDNLPLENKDGRRFTVEFVSHAYQVAGQRVLQCNIRDISLRLQAQQGLEAAQKQLQYLINNTQEAIFLTDLKGQFTFANPAAERLTGYTMAQLLHMHMLELAAPEHHALLRERMRQRVAGALKPQPFSFEISHKEGHRLWVELNTTGVFDAAGRLVGVEGVVRNITERKKSEAKVQRLAMAVEQASETIMITDVQGTILYVNPAFEKITGYTAPEVLGRNPRLLRSGKQDAAFYRQMWSTLTRGEVWHGHFINQRKDGTLYEEDATISPIRNAGGTIVDYVAVKRDITREMLLEQQVQQSQKMEAVGQLAAGIAHDFNNLLQGILGFNELVLDKLPAFDPRREDALEVQKSAQRAAELTRQLLAFSRQQLIVPKVLDLNAVVDGMQKLLQRVLGEDIQVSKALASDLRRVRADPGQIEQVLMNLAVNARDAMPQGGRLTIGTANVNLDAEAARLQSDARPGSFVCLTVADNGVGMSAAVMAHIFEPFFTTKGMGRGTGLGLSVIYGIAKQHNGWIQVFSRVGQGSTFSLYLPSDASQPEAESAAARPAPPPPGRGERILLIEDEADVRKFGLQVLQAAGYVVGAAASLQDARACFAREAGRFDLLFSDVVLPDGNGIALVEDLLQQQPGLTVLLSSGYTDERSRGTIIAQQGFHFIQKPYAKDQLLHLIHAILAARPVAA